MLKPAIARLSILVCGLLLNLGPVDCLAQSSAWASTAPVDQHDRPDTSAVVAGTVAEIAGSTNTSRIRKEKSIHGAIRAAVLALSQQRRDDEGLVRSVIEVTTESVHAAPDYVDVIARAAASTGSIPGIESAPARIRSAAFAAARKQSGRATRPRTSTSLASVSGTAVSPGVSARVARSSLNENSGDPPSDDGRSILEPGGRGALQLSLTTSVTYDSNIYLRNENEVDETIYTIRPGATWSFGQNARTRGSVGYQVAFRNYQNDSGPSARLGSGGAQIAYEGAVVTLNAAVSHQQNDQNTRDVSGLIERELIRTESTQVQAQGSVPLSAKTSLETGASVDWIDYKQQGLVGSRNITVPVTVYTQITPKLSASSGVSFSQLSPDGNGPTSRDWYYNVGLRGSLSAKLSTRFTVGYRTREVTGQQNENLWGFDGGFDLQATEKTSLSLALSRDFGNSALGESTEDSAYTLTFATSPGLQWQLDGSLSYGTTDYGGNVFAGGQLLQTGRSDKYWTVSSSASYLFTSWLSINLKLAYQTNDSNLVPFEYNATTATLAVALQY